MNLLSFIKANRRVAGLGVVIMIIVNSIILLSVNLNKSFNDLLYLNFLIGVASTIYVIVGYIDWCSKYKLIRESLDSNKDIDATISEDDSFYTLLLKDIITKKNLEADLQKQELKKSIDELNDYIMKWVHEIKIPVSVCELILERTDDYVLVNEIQAEFEKIKFLTNQVLYISRATNYYEDLSVKNTNLAKIIKNSLKRNSTLLISKNIEIKISNLDFEILSDEKWISYIIDQILNNAYKYLNQDGKIEISSELDDSNNIILSIMDNGIGILKKDISRIFDKSFTGNNKSNASKSTGMGLYITKKMLNKLGHKIEVESESNVFTKFTITFYGISDYTFNMTKL